MRFATGRIQTGRSSLMAFVGQSIMHAPQCQHSSGYATTGPFSLSLGMSPGHISTHLKQLMQFSLNLGGIIWPPLVGI